MLRDTSMANTRSRSTCSAARANGIWVRTSVTRVSTHRKFLMTVVFPASAAKRSATKPRISPEGRGNRRNTDLFFSRSPARIEVLDGDDADHCLAAGGTGAVQKK